MRYLIKFSYDGTKFHGFQRQKNVKNVQGTIEKVLSNILQEKIIIKGSGRTDAGVHAFCQCAHFDTTKKITANKMQKINKALNHEIVIKTYQKVKSNFHARHNVKWKKYLYKIYLGNSDTSKKGYYYEIKGKLNIKNMKNTAKLFEGTHDFRNFVSGKRINYITTIFHVKITKRGKTIILEFKGVGFYRYMIRHLVGAIIDVGRGKVDKNVVFNMLHQINIPKTLSVVPAEGLYLAKIKY